MSLLQKLQAAQNKDSDTRRTSMKTLAVPSGSGSGSGSGGGGGGGSPGGTRRTSGNLQGPRKASMSSGGSHGATAGPSLMGLLASKRLAKRFASRFHNRRWGRMSGAGGMPVQKEPTYRMEPHRKFNSGQVEDLIKTVLEEKLSKFRYSPKICANMCKILADDIKDKVKLMNFDRYKLVVNVTIGQKKNQALVISSRCTWDDNLDDYASHTFQNEHIYCTATMFGVYAE